MKRILIIVWLICIMTVGVFASDLGEASGVEALYSALPEEAEARMGDVSPEGGVSLGEGVENILSSVLRSWRLSCFLPCSGSFPGQERLWCFPRPWQLG